MAYARAGRLLAAVTALAVTAGCGLLDGGAETRPAPVAATPAAQNTYDPAYEEAPEPTGATEPEPEAATPSEKPSRKPSKKPAPTEDPNNFTPPDCVDYVGTEVSKKKAKSALLAAAAKRYWPTSAPKLKVPGRLVLATAWQESGWTSNIVNCDGGFGLMQVMPDTEAFVNQRFEQSYDSHDHRQNAVLGANYLAWLTKAFGDEYFDGDYDLSAGRCKSTTSRCLLNLVIAGYNVGRGTVDEAYAAGELPVPEYVGSVRALMKSCYCDRY